jgi:hypothetical protein
VSTVDRESVEYLRRLSKLVLIEKKRREVEAIDLINAGIALRVDEINKRRELINKIDEVIEEKSHE